MICRKKLIKSVSAITILFAVCLIYSGCSKKNETDEVYLTHEEYIQIEGAAYPDILDGSREWDDWDEKQRKVADPQSIQQRIDNYLTFDGLKLKSGKTFYKESMYLSGLYAELAVSLDVAKDCQGVSDAVAKLSKVINSDRYILVYPEFSEEKPRELKYPGADGYEASKQGNREGIAYTLEEDIRGCEIDISSIEK